jgi:hypothetical protein
VRIRPSRLVFIIAAGSALSLAARAGEPPKRDDILAPEEVKAGMKGFGLTVFRGSDPERIRAVSRNGLPDGAQGTSRRTAAWALSASGP